MSLNILDSYISYWQSYFLKLSVHTFNFLFKIQDAPSLTFLGTLAGHRCLFDFLARAKVHRCHVTEVVGEVLLA